MKIRSQFKVANWSQKDLELQISEQSLMKVSAIFESSEEIKGTFIVEYLMYCQHHNEEDPHNTEARYTGFIIFDGEINGKKGTFAIEDVGVYKNSSPASILTVIDYSGTNDFSGISGTGKYFAEDGKMFIELDYLVAD